MNGKIARLTINSSTLKDGVKVIQDFLKTVSDQPGVYRMLNLQGEALYVGKAKNLKKRIVAYTHPEKLPVRLQRMIAETVQMTCVITHTETEALLLESNLIKKLQPRYNVLLKDDKSFPYILLTKDHPFARVVKHRGPQTQKGLYFGPFASAEAVDEAILQLQKVLQLRNCTDSYFSNRTRPCLQYHIKRCTAPCVGFVSESDYAEQAKQAKQFLEGKTALVQQFLSEKMQQASAALKFEQAAALRDCLKLLTHIQAHQRINVAAVRNADIIALAHVGYRMCVQIFFFRHGRNFGTQSYFLSHTQDQSPEIALAAFINQFYQEHTPPEHVLLSHVPSEFSLLKVALTQYHKIKTHWEIPQKGIKKELVDHALVNAQQALARALQEEMSFNDIFANLTNVFKLPQVPQRIEIYDNTHLQGTSAYGVMVVATPEGFNKKAYRKFAIKDPAITNDDFAMMREVMQRRFQHVQEWGMPDLLLIDGGKGQLTAVTETLQTLNINVPVIAIAKGPKRNAGEEQFYTVWQQDPITFEKTAALLYFLQRLRDEAHRFAIGTHRAKREKTLKQSALDDIPGIGPGRKKLLLHHFGSAKGVQGASIAELLRVAGISKTVAEKIYTYFHEK